MEQCADEAAVFRVGGGDLKTKQAIKNIKAAGHDLSEEYGTEECLELLNTAIQEVAGLLIAANAPEMVHETTLHEGESLPARYVRGAGQYPIRVTAGRVSLLDAGATDVRFRYFATPPPLADDAGEMPFQHDALNDYAVKVAVLFALNRNEYDITQDKALYDELRQIIMGAG